MNRQIKFEDRIKQGLVLLDMATHQFLRGKVSLPKGVAGFMLAYDGKILFEEYGNQSGGINIIGACDDRFILDAFYSMGKLCQDRGLLTQELVDLLAESSGYPENNG